MNTSHSLASLSSQMADAVETAGQSLVTVYGRERQAATGIVIGPELALTADHVLERDDNLSIGDAAGNKHLAVLIGRDASSDLALLRVAGLAAVAATGAATTRVGQIALALGRPSADGVQASAGIVSQIAGPLRTGRGAQLERYLRTDAIPYPGFSGGALIDATGAVYGVLTTGLARGVAVAIPFDVARGIAEKLSQHGSVKRGYLGVATQQVALPSAHRRAGGPDGALLIVNVEAQSPAERAGLLLGDMLTGIQGRAIGDADDLLGALAAERPGATATLDIIRGGQRAQVTVTIGEKK